jgi:hypothetical protein
VAVSRRRGGWTGQQGCVAAENAGVRGSSQGRLRQPLLQEAALHLILEELELLAGCGVPEPCFA